MLSIETGITSNATRISLAYRHGVQVVRASQGRPEPYYFARQA